MIYKRLAGAFAALALSTTGALAFNASPAQAEDGHFPAAGWLVQDTIIGADVDWSDCDPGPVRFDAALSAIVSAEVAGLTTPLGVPAPPHYGTSVETADLGLPVSAGDVVTVDYVLMDGASAAGGAVRLFIYASPDSDTDCTEPAAFVAAPDDGSTSGTLSLTVPFDGQIGSLGLVYDSSNGGVGGTVRFSELVVADTPVLFVERPIVEPTEPVEEPEPSTDLTNEPAPGAGDSAAAELPVTGAGVWPLVAIGGAIAAGGVGIYLMTRRKPARFMAE